MMMGALLPVWPCKATGAVNLRIQLCRESNQTTHAPTSTAFCK